MQAHNSHHIYRPALLQYEHSYPCRCAVITISSIFVAWREFTRRAQGAFTPSLGGFTFSLYTLYFSCKFYRKFLKWPHFSSCGSNGLTQHLSTYFLQIFHGHRRPLWTHVEPLDWFCRYVAPSKKAALPSVDSSHVAAVGIKRVHLTGCRSLVIACAGDV